MVEDMQIGSMSRAITVALAARLSRRRGTASVLSMGHKRDIGHPLADQNNEKSRQERP
jgi:hypothetical protein